MLDCLQLDELFYELYDQFQEQADLTLFFPQYSQ